MNFRRAAKSMAQATKKALTRGGITTDQIDLMIPHQANLRIIEVDGYGNMSAATVPVALEFEFVNVICARRGSRGASGLRLMAPRFAEAGLLPGLGSYGK